MLEMAAVSDKDPFGDLPDELLWRVLSFLPADDALQTCVLDTRWRDLWRHATSLLFVFDGPTFPRYKRFEQLVKLVIHLRGNSALIRCEIDAYPHDEPEDTFTNTRLLIDYALACKAEELVVRAAVFDVPLSLISRHLRTIHLERVNLYCSDLKFSGCPVLEDLTIQFCNIHARKMSSKSLKRLFIIDCCSLPDIVRLRICAPSLISLQLEDFEGLTPFLENMPLLETAHVNLDDGCHDHCRSNRGVCDNFFCGCHTYPVKEGVLLNSLSNAAKLDLIALPKMFLYRWDLKWCPVFGELKTLLLNEWFTAVDLVCILRHSPVLEILTLQLDNTEIHPLIATPLIVTKMSGRS
ncbi:putative FBD-associated F-box protein At5g38570 isoform X2 [Triticum dicoccoides]|uniref:putative FBD-associated F-box protein At5g38570 isoform X2 n=1 Tax=Triticum dicoccoides TaxID=85692 RepID=UPI000E794C40|nr:putative FBD-associated F-box protein At5g38570 isoform X2 [Triticum dicoccoides]